MPFNFNPPDGLENQTEFPSKPATGVAAREQFMRLFNQIKTWINSYEAEYVQQLQTIGYQRIPNGLLTQWFNVSTAVTGGVIKELFLPYPITFPNAAFIVVGSISISGDASQPIALKLTPFNTSLCVATVTSPVSQTINIAVIAKGK